MFGLDNWMQQICAPGGATPPPPAAGNFTVVYWDSFQASDSSVNRYQTWAEVWTAASGFAAQSVYVFIDISAQAPVSPIQIPNGTYDGLGFITIGVTTGAIQASIESDSNANPLTLQNFRGFANLVMNKQSSAEAAQLFLNFTGSFFAGAANLVSFGGCFLRGTVGNDLMTGNPPFMVLDFSNCYANEYLYTYTGAQQTFITFYGEQNTMEGDNNTKCFGLDFTANPSCEIIGQIPTRTNGANTNEGVWAFFGNQQPNQNNFCQNGYKNFLMDLNGVNPPNTVKNYTDMRIINTNATTADIAYAANYSVLSWEGYNIIDLINSTGNVQFTNEFDINGTLEIINNTVGKIVPGNAVINVYGKFILPDDTLTGSTNLTVNVFGGDVSQVSETHAGYTGTLTINPFPITDQFGYYVAGADSAFVGEVSLQDAIDQGVVNETGFTYHAAYYGTSIRDHAGDFSTYVALGRQYSFFLIGGQQSGGEQFSITGAGSQCRITLRDTQAGIDDQQSEPAEVYNTLCIFKSQNFAMNNHSLCTVENSEIRYDNALNSFGFGFSGVSFKGKSIISVNAGAGGLITIAGANSLDFSGESLTVAANTFTGSGTLTVNWYSGDLSNFSLSHAGFTGQIIFNDLRDRWVQVINTEYFVQQGPIAFDTPTNIIFNAGNISTTYVDYRSATNDFLVNVDGRYQFLPHLQIGKTGGNTVFLFAAFINGVQQGETVYVQESGGNQIPLYHPYLTLDVVAGDVVDFQWMCDSSGGAANAILTPLTPANPAFNASPSAGIIVSRRGS